jgi:hypothetical protein
VPLSGFETYTVRLGRADQQGQALAVPVRLLQGLLRDDPVAERIVSGVLAMNAEALRPGAV